MLSRKPKWPLALVPGVQQVLPKCWPAWGVPRHDPLGVFKRQKRRSHTAARRMESEKLPWVNVNNTVFLSHRGLIFRSREPDSKKEKGIIKYLKGFFWVLEDEGLHEGCVSLRNTFEMGTVSPPRRWKMVLWEGEKHILCIKHRYIYAVNKWIKSVSVTLKFHDWEKS